MTGHTHLNRWSSYNPERLYSTAAFRFNEDQNRARSGHAIENLATLRRWALNFLKADTRKAKRSIKGKIKAAGWDHAYLLHLLSVQPI